MVELLEERLPLNMGPTVSMSSPPAPMASAPLAAAPATASTPPASASVADAAPISASGTPAALLFDPHQPIGMVPADVPSGSGPPLQQGAPPRFSYNLETNITGEGDGAANEPLTAPSHSGGGTPNGVPVGETLRGLPFDVNQEAATPAGVPRFSFGPQTAPRSPLESRDLPGLRPGMAPSPNNRTNPTQVPESAPGTQPTIPPANERSVQRSDVGSGGVAAAPAPRSSDDVFSQLRFSQLRPDAMAGQGPAIDLVAAELASVLPSSQHASGSELNRDSIDRALTEQGATLPEGDGNAHDRTPSVEGALISGAMLTAARRPRQDSWPLDDVRRNFQLGMLERLTR